MAAADDWDRLVDGIPPLRDAFAALGTRGGERRSRVRRRAAALDAAALTLPDIAWELQEAAADGETRSRVSAAHARHRHEARGADAPTPPETPTRTATAASGGAGHTAGFVIALILAFLAPALVMPRFRGGGFVYDVDQVALLSGVASLAIAIVGLVYVRRAARPLFGVAIPVILAVWVVVGAVVASLRIAEEPAFASPSALTGIVLMGAAAVVHALSALSRRGAAPAPAAAVALDGSADELAAALADEDADAALLRRAAYADGILTLMKRGELDVYDAEHLLRDYAL